MASPKTYSYEKYSFKVITPLMAVISIAFLVNGAYIGGSITIVLGVLFAFSYQGVIIDPLEKKYIRYDRFLNFKIGGWKPLPKPSYVSIVRINLSSSRSSPTPMVVPQDKQGARAFKVNLVVEGQTRYVSVCRGSLENMTKEALRLGEHLQIRVADFSTNKKKWIL